MTADDPSSFKGRLVVASPTLIDPNFFRTVVLVLDHDEDGAIGVVLNRPSETSVAEVLAGWEVRGTEPFSVFVGGPVRPEAAVCLATPVDPDRAPPGFRPLLDWVGSLDVSGDPALATPAVARLRVFAGYAGWAPSQLEGEVARRDWFVLDAVPDDLFGTEPEGLWRRVVGRQGGRLRLVANFPLHPSLN